MIGLPSQSGRCFPVVLLLLLAGCSGGSGGSASSSSSTASSSSSSSSSSNSSSSSSTSVASVTKAEAFRFLNQATMGATEADAAALIASGNANTAYASWLDGQLAMPATNTYLAYVTAAYPNPVPTGFNVSSLHANRVDQWFQNALHANDQLRQRVAYALSQILVVSQIGALQDLPFAVSDYYDLLGRDAFGNYRQLLQDVTLHPAMGIYLSMLGNQKANTASNIRPDENYARELMQLFTIGLVQLNLDGTPKLDANGQPIPTYNQNVIEGFARVYTGWKWACPTTNSSCTFANTQVQRTPVAGFNQVKPMQFYSDQNETGSKQVLSYTGVANSTIAAGQTGPQDLQAALDNIFNHPNVGPFVAKQLIQKLVTSNPSAAYVQRVASVFNNDGSGTRGNLAAVIRSLLLDSEARSAIGSNANTAGKLKEPLLRITQLWRAYDAKAASGKYLASTNFSGGGILSPSTYLGQGPLQSPSVFNFFSPGYAPPGEISDAGLIAPELQLANEYLNTNITNFIWTQAANRTTTQTTLAADVVFIDTREEITLAADSQLLLNRVAEKLLGGAGQLSATLQLQAKQQIERSAVTASGTRVTDAIYLIGTSPEFAIQH